MCINDVNADAHSEVVEDLPATVMNSLECVGKLSDFVCHHSLSIPLDGTR